MHRLGHPVEELQLERRVRQTTRARVRDRVRETPDVVAAEGGTHLPGVVDEVPRAALVIGVGLGLRLEDGDRPSLGAGDDRLPVPVGALDETDLERRAKRRPRPVDQRPQVRVRVLPVGLHDAAELRPVGESGADRSHELERQVLRLVVLGVEMDRRTGGARAFEERAKPAHGGRETFGGGGGCEQRRQRRRLDRDVDPRHRAPGVALEDGLGGPGRRRRDERVQRRACARRVAVRLRFGDDVLAEQVDGARLARAPQALELRQRRLRVGARDELARHPAHVPPRDGGRDLGAERQVTGEPERDAERTGHVDALEVLLEVSPHVGVVVASGEDVDEAEELGLEARMRHGPEEQLLAPPAEVVDTRLLGAGGVGDAAGEGLHVALEGVGHRRPG